MRKRVSCPFCEGDGCCFCDHEGEIYVGPKELIKSEEGLNSIGVKYLKSEDPGETWPEMWGHFLNEKNVPNAFKATQSTPDLEALAESPLPAFDAESPSDRR